MAVANNASRWPTVIRVVMVVQAAASLLIWLAQLRTTVVHLDHGQEVPGAAALVNVVNPLIAALLLTAALTLRHRPALARPLAVAMEAAGILGSLISVFTGFYQALLAVALAIAVIVMIYRYVPTEHRDA